MKYKYVHISYDIWSKSGAIDAVTYPIKDEQELNYLLEKYFYDIDTGTKLKTRKFMRFDDNKPKDFLESLITDLNLWNKFPLHEEGFIFLTCYLSTEESSLA